MDSADGEPFLMDLGLCEDEAWRLVQDLALAPHFSFDRFDEFVAGCSSKGYLVEIIVRVSEKWDRLCQSDPRLAESYATHERFAAFAARVRELDLPTNDAPTREGPNYGFH
jgi:hypothetical protein